MKQLKQKLKTLIFGERAKAQDPIITTYHTSHPQLPRAHYGYKEWCEEFRVGMLYDRKAYHLN